MMLERTGMFSWTLLYGQIAPVSAPRQVLQHILLSMGLKKYF